jgi:hypothetical protein
MMERNRLKIKPRMHEWMTQDSCIREKFVDGVWVRLASLRELQSATGEELEALSLSPSVASGIPSVLDRAFRGRRIESLNETRDNQF